MKAIMKSCLAATLLFTGSCKKETTASPSKAATTNASKATTAHILGESFGGGIIFYLDTAGEHGLIAATSDIGTAYWTKNEFYETGASRTDIKGGPSNTQKIVTSKNAGDCAAVLCARYKSGGHADWFLPSLDEMSALFKQRKLVGGFDGTLYWTSTEDGLQMGWAETFTKPQQVDTWFKSVIASVRPVRKF